MAKQRANSATTLFAEPAEPDILQQIVAATTKKRKTADTPAGYRLIAVGRTAKIAISRDFIRGFSEEPYRVYVDGDLFGEYKDVKFVGEVELVAEEAYGCGSSRTVRIQTTKGLFVK